MESDPTNSETAAARVVPARESCNFSLHMTRARTVEIIIGRFPLLIRRRTLMAPLPGNGRGTRASFLKQLTDKSLSFSRSPPPQENLPPRRPLFPRKPDKENVERLEPTL